jgi:hypothetical protein
MAESFQTRFVHEFSETGGAVKLRITVENLDMDYANAVEVQQIGMKGLAEMLAWAENKVQTTK